MRRPSPEVRIYLGERRLQPPMNTEQSSPNTMHEQSSGVVAKHADRPASKQSDMPNKPDEVARSPSRRGDFKSPEQSRQPSVGKPRRLVAEPAGKASSPHRGSSQSPIQIDDSQETIEIEDVGPLHTSHIYPKSSARERHVADELVKRLGDARYQSTVDQRRNSTRDDLDDERELEIRETPEPAEIHTVIEV